MHSSEALAGTDFEYRRAGESVAREDVMPSIGVSDRVGVVTDGPCDGLGAATFVLSCAVEFYDRYREQDEDARAYPDYFTFQTDSRLVDYGWLEIYPSHKNVQVRDEPETTLRAINDRAIDVLLVPESRATDADVEDVTYESARRRIDACYVYAPGGDLDDPEFTVQLPSDPIREWMQRILDTSADGSLRERHETAWNRRIEDGDDTITQGFRRVELDEAIHSLPASEW